MEIIRCVTHNFRYLKVKKVLFKQKNVPTHIGTD